MKLSKLYDLAIKFGIRNDPRKTKEIREDLKRVRKHYDSLKGVEKKCFDKVRFTHPYSDTRILNGAPDTNVKTILVGVDMEAPELLLADRLMDKGMPIDLVVAHHPGGYALANLSGVMHLQKDVLIKFGLKPDIAKKLMDERIAEVDRGISATNHTRGVDAAKLLGIPYMCIHTPADNHVATYLERLFATAKPKKIKDVMGLLFGIPEYRLGAERSAGPTLISGKENNKAGKVFVDMTGGTEGSKAIFARLSQAGVDTIVAMHFSETHYKNAKAEDINVIIAGHIASDCLGLNLLLDNVERTEKLNIIGCSGFDRVKRK